VIVKWRTAIRVSGFFREDGKFGTALLLSPVCRLAHAGYACRRGPQQMAQREFLRKPPGHQCPRKVPSYLEAQALTQFMTVTQSASVHTEAAATTHGSVGERPIAQDAHAAGVAPASWPQMKSEQGSSQVAPVAHWHFALMAESYLALPVALF